MSGDSTDYIPIQLPDGVTLQPFKPVAYVEAGMDMLIAIVEDASTVTHWHDLICVETLRDAYTDQLVGYHIVCLNGLQGKWPTNWSVFLLSRALWFDLRKNKKRKLSVRQTLDVYAPLLWLTIRTPRLWRIRE